MRNYFALLLVLSCLAALSYSPPAEAADPVVCTVTTSTSAAAYTTPAAGCSWPKASVVLFQCTADHYVDSTGIVDAQPLDGGVSTALPDGGARVASSADQLVEFTNNKDPYPIYLGNNDQHISVLAVSNQTDGGAPNCKFMTTQRRKPW